MIEKYFTKKEALEAIKETLENFDSNYCDLDSEVFNTGYYMVGTYEAKKALEQYGLFNAIEKVQEYEKENFGEIYTDLSNPEKLANMLWYVIGYETLQDEINEELYDVWDEVANEEKNKELIELIDSLL